MIPNLSRTSQSFHFFPTLYYMHSPQSPGGNSGINLKAQASRSVTAVVSCFNFTVFYH